MKYDFLPEISEIHNEYKYHRNKTRKLLSKIKRIESEFDFLERIVEPRKDTDTKEDDVELEFAVMRLFETLNFKCDKPISEADVDVKVKFKDFYFGLEVKNGSVVKENELIQPEKHKRMNEDSFHPIIVYNNAKTNANWDDSRKLISSKFNFGIITTKELLKGYVKLRKNKITFEQFLKQLNKTGEIKFTKSALRKDL